MVKRVLFILAAAVTAAAAVYIYIHSNSSPVQGGYVRVLCLGDSLTAGSYGQYTRTLKHLFQESKQRGELGELDVRVNVYGAAKPGHTSGEYLEYFKKSKLLDKIYPHIVVIMLGTNDVRIDGDNTSLPCYKKNMAEIISIIQNHRQPGGTPRIFIAAPPPVFICDLPTFDTSSSKRLREEIVPAIRQMAKQYQIELLDVFSFFEMRRGLLPGVHPNKEGYRALAGFIYRQILDYLRDNPHFKGGR